ncbi:protein hexamerization [Globodera pallida]|nr:protein hexamerization [Globodera pallida]
MTSNRFCFEENKYPEEYILSYASFPVSNVLNECVCCRFSIHPRHENICALGTERGKVLICDVTAPIADREFVKNSFSAGDNAVFDLCYIPNHPNWLLSLCGASRLELWDVERSSSVLLLGHHDSVRCASVWPENPFCFLTGSRDGAILVWDLRDKPLRKGIGRKYAGNSIVSARQYQTAHEAAISITGILHLSENYFISSSTSASSGIRIWDLRYQVASSPVRTLFVPQQMSKESGIASMCWDRFRSSFFAVCTDNAIYEYVPSLNSEFPVRSLRAKCINSFFVQCATSPLSDHLLCGSSLSKAFIWDLQENRKYFQSAQSYYEEDSCCLPNSKFVLDGHGREVECVQWSSRGRFMITMDSEIIRIWSKWTDKTEHGYPEEVVMNHRPLKFTYPKLHTNLEEATSSSSQTLSQKTYGSENRSESRASEDNDIQLLGNASASRCAFDALGNLPSLYASSMEVASTAVERGNNRGSKQTIVIKSNSTTTPARQIPRVEGHDNFSPMQQHKTPMGKRRNLTAEFQKVTGSATRKRYCSDVTSPLGRPTSRTASTTGGSAKKRTGKCKKRDDAECVKLAKPTNILSYFERVQSDLNSTSSSSHTQCEIVVKMFDFSEDPLVIAFLSETQAALDGLKEAEEDSEDDQTPSDSVQATNVDVARPSSLVAAESDDILSDNKTISVHPIESKTSLLKNVEPKLGEEILGTIVETTDTRLDDIEGNAMAKLALEENVVLPALNPKLFTGLRAPCTGILLFGPPGNGKTMLAKAVANECHSTFFSISAATIMSRWVGDGERLVKALFQVARNAQPSIIFIDEVDSMLCQRFEQEDGAARRVKTEFLVRLDGCSSGRSDDRVLVLAATNRPQELDEGILRRFPQRIFIDLPDKMARFQMIRRTFEQNSTELQLSDVELEKIASKTDNYSYSDLKALCRAAALLPVQSARMENRDLRRCTVEQLRPVNLNDLESAVRSVRPSVNAESRRKLFEFAENHANLST